MIENRNQIVKLLNTVPPVTAGTASVTVFQGSDSCVDMNETARLNLVLVLTGCLDLVRGVAILEGRSIRSCCGSNPEPLQASALSCKVM